MSDTRYTPPMPHVPRSPLSLPSFLRCIRTNALSMWSTAAYEEEVLTRSVFGRPQMLLNNPAAIHRVLVDNHANYRRSPASVRILRPITGQGLLLSEGDDWKLQRRTIAPALAPRVIPMLAGHIASVAEETVAELAAQANNPVDLRAAMVNTALEIAGRSMFSLEMHKFGPGLREQVIEYGLHWSQPHLLDLLLPPAIPSIRDLGRRRFRKRWLRFMDELMDARMATPPSAEPRDLFDLLLAAFDPETGRGFSHDQLRDQTATMILAGHATTALTLFWALLLLGHAPAEQKRLANEVRGLDLGPESAAESLPRLVYTRAVVSESLRLFPPAFTITRAAIQADRSGDIEIPAGAVLMIAPWVLHRHRRLWRDPNVFDPTRFLPDRPPPPRFAYLPFGAGPRVCVGAQFALTEAILVLAAMIQAFEVEVTDERPVLPVAVVTTQPDHSPAFHLRRRAQEKPWLPSTSSVVIATS
jgi:cytochrome P450